MASESSAKTGKATGRTATVEARPRLFLAGQQPFTLLQRFIHFCKMSAMSFVRNRCPVRASALAYTTLLALVPLLAVGISVSTAFLQKDGSAGVEAMIDQIVGSVAPQLNLETGVNGDPAQAARRAEAVTKITEFVKNIQTGTLGITGMVGLVAVAITLLTNIEATFNDIWGVSRGRNWFARIINYWAAVTLGPILFVVAIGLTTGPHLKNSEALLREMPYVGSLIFDVIPFVIPSVGFAVFYKLMPNTKVEWPAAFVGGLAGGVLWQLNNIFNVIYVSKVVTYSKIYGSLGILPVFLFGLYFSWLILLLGAQLSYTFQNREAFRQEEISESINHRGRELVAVQSITLIGRRFLTGGSMTTAEIASELGVPSRLVQQVIAPLQTSNLVQEAGHEGSGYMPARPLAQITVHDILKAMRSGVGQELNYQDDPATALVREEFERIEGVESTAAGTVTLEQLVQRTAAAAKTA